MKLEKVREVATTYVNGAGESCKIDQGVISVTPEGKIVSASGMIHLLDGTPVGSFSQDENGFYLNLQKDQDVAVIATDVCAFLEGAETGEIEAGE
jgi:hypothetical protein